MDGLDQIQIDGYASCERADGALVRRLQHAPRRRTTHDPDSLEGALHALEVAEALLVGALRDNESLRIDNEHLMQSLEDASRRAVAAQRVAHHDGLTGLPNRLFLIRRLQQATKSAHQRHRQLVLLFIDLDGFKAVNDRFGHTVADRLLTAVGARIAACIRADDIACRYGGDEFVALLTNLNDAAVAVSVSDNIREHIGQSYTIDGNEIHITASIGLAVYPENGERYDALLRHADAAMFRDKTARRAQRMLGGRGSPGVEHREQRASTRLAG